MRELMSDLEELRLALRLPFRLYDGETSVHAAPEPLQAKDPLANLPIVRGHSLIPQHVKSPFSERFIFLELDTRWSLLIGPYVYPDDDADVQMMVRRGLYDINELADISAYFESLIRIDYRSAAAIGRVTSERYAYRKAKGECPYGSDGVGEPQSLQEHSPAALLPDNYYEAQAKGRARHFSHPSILFEDELSASIETGNLDAALAALRRINRLARATLADQPLRSLKNSLIGSMTIFTRAAIAGGVPDQTSFTLSDAYIRQIESAAGREQLEGMEERAILAFVDLVKEENRQRYSPVVLRILRYIDVHLTGDLSLKRLADEVHLHPNYLSSRFRRETGQRLSGYVREKRLEEAAHMIRYTSNSLKQIGAFFRFNSQSHFSRAFKARFGVSFSTMAGSHRQKRKDK